MNVPAQLEFVKKIKQWLESKGAAVSHDIETVTHEEMNHFKGLLSYHFGVSNHDAETAATHLPGVLPTHVLEIITGMEGPSAEEVAAKAEAAYKAKAEEEARLAAEEADRVASEQAAKEQTEKEEAERKAAAEEAAAKAQAEQQQNQQPESTEGTGAKDNKPAAEDQSAA